MTLTQKKEYAEILFCERQLLQKVVAKKAGISPKTMSKWVKEFGWEKKRKRLLISRDNQLTNFYDQLDLLNQSIKDGSGFPNSKQADSQLKLTAAIRNLEIELSIADKIKSMMDFIKFTQRTEPTEKVIEITDLCDGFIQSLLT